MKVLSRELQEAELDEIAKLMRIVPRQSLQSALVQKHLAFHDTVMVHRDSRLSRRGTHFRRYGEPFGPGLSGIRYYIRMGKRGQVKRYLDSCDITFINGEPSLFEYRTEG